MRDHDPTDDTATDAPTSGDVTADGTAAASPAVGGADAPATDRDEAPAAAAAGDVAADDVGADDVGVDDVGVDDAGTDDAGAGPVGEAADRAPVDDHEDATAEAPGGATDAADQGAADAADRGAGTPAGGTSLDDDDEDDLPRPTPRAVVQSVGVLVAAVLAGVLAVIPAPYAVNSPGPTRDVLGKVGDEPLIKVAGAETYPSSGELRLTTMSSVGGPGYPAFLLDVLGGWFSRTSIVRPVEQVYPTDVTPEEFEDRTAGEMLSSQDNAAVAALVELGYEVPATLVVAGTVPGSNAEGLLEEGDVLTALDGTPLPDYQTLVHMLEDVTPGDVVTLTVRRHARDVDVDVTTTERAGGGAQIGVYIDPAFDMPVDVEINIDDIGGPSAGTMFALGLVDLLTPEDEAAGQVIAGTGTMDVVGKVGTIGGIRQKLAGARRDGATWFLAPAGNCEDLIGYVPDGLRVVPVATLHEAREAMTAIGQGEGDDLPTCEDVVDG